MGRMKQTAKAKHPFLSFASNKIENEKDSSFISTISDYVDSASAHCRKKNKVSPCTVIASLTVKKDLEVSWNVRHFLDLIKRSNGQRDKPNLSSSKSGKLLTKTKIAYGQIENNIEEFLPAISPSKCAQKSTAKTTKNPPEKSWAEIRLFILNDEIKITVIPNRSLYSAEEDKITVSVAPIKVKLNGHLIRCNEDQKRMKEFDLYATDYSSTLFDVAKAKEMVDEKGSLNLLIKIHYFVFRSETKQTTATKVKGKQDNEDEDSDEDDDNDEDDDDDQDEEEDDENEGDEEEEEDYVEEPTPPPRRDPLKSENIKDFNFSFSYNDTASADMKIKVLAGNKTLFPCHRLILIARCPGLREILANIKKPKDKEECSFTKDVILEVEDISAETMEHFLSFVYCGHFQNDSWIKTLPQLAFAADKYQVNSLKDVCDFHMIRLVTWKTVLDLGQIAERYGLQYAAAKIRKFIAVNAEEVSLDSGGQLNLQITQK